MLMLMKIGLGILAMESLAAAAAAQTSGWIDVDQAKVEVRDKQPLGQYLTDDKGRAV